MFGHRAEEATMQTSETITLSLPKEAITFIKTKVASGEFGSASSVVEKSLSLLQSDAEYLERWLSTEIVRRYDELLAHPELGISLEEVEASLAEEFGEEFPELPKAG
jgi:Arc/MetJ-type ribon-helix-helix transcriptional regulator